MNMTSPSRLSFIGCLVLGSVCAGVVPNPTFIPATGYSLVAAAEPRDPVDAKQAALEWLDAYLQDSVLLMPEDVQKIRETVAQMTPTQAAEWLQRTEQLRAYIESDSWQATKQWLREFLKVQAIYSDEDIAQLRERIRKADPDELLRIMEQIQSKHATMNWMHQASEQNRRATIQGAEQYLKSSQTAAAAARKSANRRPLVGSTKPGGLATNVQKRGYKGYRTPDPLITSREVARESVRSSMFPRGGWYGW